MDVLHLCRGLHRWGNIQILEVGVLHLEPVDAVLEQRREELIPRRRDVYLCEWVGKEYTTCTQVEARILSPWDNLSTD